METSKTTVDRATIDANRKLMQKLKARQASDYKFSSYCENLADGELHIFKKDNTYYCFDVNEAYSICEMESAGGEEGEFHTELKPDRFPDYSVCIFFYPDNPSRNWLQVYYNTNTELGQIHKADFTISKLKK